MKSIRAFCGALATAAVLAPVVHATTFTVTTTADAQFPPPVGSLREAIILANQDNDLVNPTVINFNVPVGLLTATGVAVIQPVAPLPVINNIHGRGITIDGYTQGNLVPPVGPPFPPGYQAGYAPFNPSSLVVKVALDGSLLPIQGSAPPYNHGLHIMSSNNLVQGLCVHSFPHDGICLEGTVPNPDPNLHQGTVFNTIQFNIVGMDPTGLVALPNGHDGRWAGGGGLWGGIYIKVLPNSGPAIANDNWLLENICSGNAVEGIGIANCPDDGAQVMRNLVERNYVGIDITGVAPLGNGHTGVYIGEGAQDNFLQGNWIGANGFSGVSIVGLITPEIYTDGNTLLGNSIGVDRSGSFMTNGLHGVSIGAYGDGSASHHYVGGHARRNMIDRNVIAYNARCGVAVQEGPGSPDNASFNTITENRIFLNGHTDPGYLGIDLGYDGVTANDPGDPDAGPNQLINFPVLTSAVRSGGSTTVTGTLDIAGTPGPLEIFRAMPGADGSGHGQGAVFLGAFAPVGSPWSVVLPTAALPGQMITATVTDTLGNTSEFSLNIPVWDENQEPDDFGDAPDSYGTLVSSGGPQHVIVPGMYLGLSVDGERDGQPSAGATGDDTDGNDDEDGVVFPVPLIPGQPCQVDITASAMGRLDVWIDLDRNGSFHAGGEQILSSADHPGMGLTKSYAFTVPSTAVQGPSFARVRYSSGGGLLPTGPGAGGGNPDGEVEDVTVTIGQEQGEELDWGDAPDFAGAPRYPTLSTNNGASHIASPLLCIGSVVDTEMDGQPTANADGDDLAGVPDDEDGVTWYTMIPGTMGQVDIVVTGAGVIDAWVDFNANGSWGDTGEYVVMSQPAVGGLNTYTFLVPVGAVTGQQTYARVRLSTQGGLSPGGGAPDGEVEDDPVTIEEGVEEMDWGDAPDSAAAPGYPTLLANNGARHPLVGGPYLGAVVDPEANGQPTTNADGDDLNGVPDDEDGVVFPISWITGVPTHIVVNAPLGGILQGWVDWNADGDWADASEQIITNRVLSPGANLVPVSVPHWAGLATYARFRISSQAGLGYAGPAPDGEVEDYRIDFDQLKWTQPPEQGQEGVDVSNTQYMLADDFLCNLTGPITDIHIWGSFLADILPQGGPENMTIHLSIWSDVPVAPDNPYSHPGEKLWEAAFTPGTYHAGLAHEVPEGEWWHDPSPDPAQATWIPNADRGIYQFDFYPEDPFIQEEGAIYWLAMKYESEGDFQFGWKTTPESWNDDAAFIDPDNMAAGWFELVYGGGHPREGESMDLAFALSTEEEQGEELDYGDAPDPTYPTLLASNGARHVIVPGVFLGNLVDAEPDGQPDPTATGDDVLDGSDDEDGVTITNPLIPGQLALLQVNASVGGWVDAWIDYNLNGLWDHPAELVYSGPVVAGTNPLAVPVPGGAQPGGSFVRVRFNTTQGPLLPTGWAADGEVEDVAVKIDEPAELDWGDAPDGPYPTVLVSNGARHRIVPGMFLGGQIDGEFDGQPDPAAQGDDANNLNDEDGVNFYPMVQGSTGTVDISASVSGRIDAWVDFNADGIWGAAEKILSNALITPGITPSQYTFAVPGGAVLTPTFARVRYSSSGGLSPAGYAADGEVEDYEVTIQPAGSQIYDFGDAPDPAYPTLAASNGARHLLAGPMLGQSVDPEVDGQPDATATGDDLAGTADEDGVTFLYPLYAGQQSMVRVEASLPGMVDAWIDFNRDGAWSGGEQILNTVPVNPGPNDLVILVPGTPGSVVGGNTFARFRISTMGGLAPTGAAIDGEVEDHLVTVHEDGSLDFGDAPDPTFPTLLASNGAAHSLGNIFLGAAVDADFDGQPTAAADGDDNDGNDDEDGITFLTPVIGGHAADINVLVTGPPPGPPGFYQIDAWVDFNNDGDWLDAGEQVITGQPVMPGPQVLGINVPWVASPRKVAARFRLSPGGAPAPDGFVADGEVEDYLIPIGKRVNSSISVSFPNVTLDWTNSVEPAATSYSVYSSTNLGAFPSTWSTETTGATGPPWTWTDTLSTPYPKSKFYNVVAFP